MTNYREPVCFTGPYGRYHRAVYEQKHPEYPRSTNPWVRKLVAMLEQRAAYGNDRQSYAVDWPTFARMFDTFEDTSVGSTKEMLEALLLCTRDTVDENGDNVTEPVSYAELSKVFGADLRFNEYFLALYQELFYNIREKQSNTIAMMRYVLLPIMTGSGSRLAVGALWKLLAYGGGFEALKRRGFSSEPMTPEDLDFLFHMLSVRNCTTMLNYITNGTGVFENNPGAVALMSSLTELESSRNPKRRPDGFRVKTVSKASPAGTLLMDFVKLIKEPVTYEDAALVHEGTFQPTDKDAIETVEVPQLDEILKEDAQ